MPLTQKREPLISMLGISLILYSRYIVFEIFRGWGNEEVVVNLGIIKVKFHYVRKKRETKPKIRNHETKNVEPTKKCADNLFLPNYLATMPNETVTGNDWK